MSEPDTTGAAKPAQPRPEAAITTLPSPDDLGHLPATVMNWENKALDDLPAEDAAARQSVRRPA